MKNVKDMFHNLKRQFLEHIPDILLSLFVLLLGYLAARLVKYLVVRFFGYLGKVARKRFHHVDFRQAGVFLGIAFFWLIIFCAILLVTDILGFTILTNWFQSIIQYIPNILAAIAIVLGAIVLGNLVSDLLISLGKQTGIKYSDTLVRVIKFMLFAVAIIIALDQIGIEISLLVDIIDIVLAALLFGAALAFGLGARTSISNILASYYLRKRYKEGDEIQIGQTRGVITKIDATCVVLHSKMGQVTIPTKIFNETESYLIVKE